MAPSAINYDNEPPVIKVLYPVLSKFEVFLVKVPIKFPRKSDLAFGVLIFRADFWRHPNDELDSRKTLPGTKGSQVYKIFFRQSFGKPKPPCVGQKTCDIAISHFFQNNVAWAAELRTALTKLSGVPISR